MAYYDNLQFINVFYQLNIAIEEFFSGLLFSDDNNSGGLDRIIYASNQYSFRKRTQNNLTTGNLDLPYMSYYIKDFDFPSDRKMFNNVSNVEGIYMETLGKKLRVVPVKIRYEGLVFFQRTDDLYNAYSRIISETSNETILYPEITVNDSNGDPQSFPISAFLGFDLGIDNLYKESEWLERNKIHTIEFNAFSFDTVILFDDQEPVSITDEVVLEFLSSKPNYAGDLSDPDSLDPQTLITNYFTE